MVNAPARHMPRHLSGLLAAAIVATALLTPSTAAQAVPVSSSACQSELAQRDTAGTALRAARVAKRAAATARLDARATFKASRTPRHNRKLVAARAAFVKALATRTTARKGLDLAQGSYTQCLLASPVTDPPLTGPSSVELANTRVSFHGSDFAVTDITWKNIPLGDYYYVVRYDDAVAQVRPATFVDVIPPWDPNIDPMDPDYVFVWYRQNDVTYPGSFFGGGCDYTPGSDLTIELWTSKDGNQPAGTKIASATVDNPCR